jgi:hypothetical protein
MILTNTDMLAMGLVTTLNAILAFAIIKIASNSKGSKEDQGDFYGSEEVKEVKKNKAEDAEEDDDEEYENDYDLGGSIKVKKSNTKRKIAFIGKKQPGKRKVNKKGKL